jgi:ABC-2 type transport system ATP-binding protein
VLVNGKSYRDLTDPLRSVGALLDAKAIVGGRSAANHLMWLADSNGIDRRRVGEVLDIVGLGDVAGKRVGTFSLGMSQRLGIAAALLGDPDTLIFDEPINGLDPDGIVWMRSLMKDLASQGRTVFLSSHLMSEMAQTADHLLVIAQGRIIADAGMQEFVNQNAVSSVRVRAVQQTDLADALILRGGVVERSPDGALLVTGMGLPGDRRRRVRPRHHPVRARGVPSVTGAGVLRADPRCNRLPRRRAGRRHPRSLT